MRKLLIFDGNAVLHRAYHALPPLTTTKGEPINAVYGMVSMLLSAVEEQKPTHIAFAFDRAEPTFRKKAFKEYQSHRPPTEDNLSSQFSKAKDVLTAMKIPFFDKAGFEADDIIGTLSVKATKTNHPQSTTHNIQIDEVVIVTGDRDQMQLVNDKVKLYMPVSGTKGKLFGIPEVKEKMGVFPKNIIDYKALVGDPSDNYPGVPGIGPKTAINLIDEYGDFKSIYKSLDKIKNTVSEKLKKGKKSAEISFRLAKIVTDVPVKFDLNSMKKWSLGNSDIVNLFKEYGFKTLTAKVKNYDLRFTINEAGQKVQSPGKVEHKKNLTKEDVVKVVSEIAMKLKGKQYAIRGTASMVLQGLDMGVTDIDVIADRTTAILANDLFKKDVVKMVEYGESDKFKSYFGQFNIDDVPVEIMGCFQIKTGSGEWSSVYDANSSQVTELEIGIGKKVRVKVTKLDIELRCAMEMGRWNEFHKIKMQMERKDQQKLF